MKLLAFIARYGHQDMPSIKRLPLTDLYAFSNALSELLTEEADAMKRATDS